MTNRQLNLATAQRLVTAVVDAATTQGIAVAVTVIDRGGHPLASARMDGLAYPFLEVSRRKAVTGSSFGSPTHMLSRYFAQDPVLASGSQALSEFLFLPGGFPVLLDAQCVGGLGIAGGRNTQDQDLGEHALAILQTQE